MPAEGDDAQGGRPVTPGVWSLSKKAANDRAAARPEVSCGACLYMFPPLAVGGCRLVRGLIRSSATCDEFISVVPGAAEPQTHGGGGDQA
jgi:hypothetical protein